MSRRLLLLLMLPAMGLAGCGPPRAAAPEPGAPARATEPLAQDAVAAGAPATIRVTSDFTEGGAIPRRFTGSYGGFDIGSPPLRWSAVAGARSYAVVMQDPDAPQARPYVHWLVWNIPAQRTALPAQIGNAPAPDGPESYRQGLNDNRRYGWTGPLPPRGALHHYHFQVFALDRMLDLQEPGSLKGLAAAMRGHVIARGELVGVHREP
jgi:Raf kinase inhibitor-like YbhB/YbcL family protein